MNPAARHLACLLLWGLTACTSVDAAPILSLPPTIPPSPTSTVPLPDPPTPIIPPSPTPSPTLTPSLPATPIRPPAPTVDPCWAAGGQIERHTLSTALSPYPWEFRVYTPPCYTQQPDRRYPLLILIHGSTFTDDQWDRLGADETSDALIASGELAPFLILMPRDRLWKDPPEDVFGQALVEAILPWVDTRYRTIPDRAHRAIGGLSRGAAWAVHLGLSRWELFGAIGGHSLPVFWADTPKIRGWLAAIPPAQLPRIFLDIGEKDHLSESAVWFEKLLTEKGISHEWYLYTGRHEEAYWQAHLEQYLRWYAAGW